MNSLAMTKGCALVCAAALFSGGVLGCTTMTVVNPPDGGPRTDASTDAGTTSPDGSLPLPVIETCTPEGMGATIGQSCTGDTDCDDGCYCNGAEACQGGACVAGDDPCPDAVDCTADSCLEEANRCFHDPRHAMCSDGDACNGTELCDLRTGCGPGTPPYCNDDNSCTVDACDSTMGCVFTPRDLDGDGYVDGHCGGLDCDDDPRYGVDIHPGAVEICDNRRDDDCDGMRDYNDPDCVPTNDTCDSAVMLMGAGTYSGSTASLAGDYTLECRGSGPDAVFHFTLTEEQDVTVTIAGGGSGTGVALRPWDQCAVGPDDKCSVSSPPAFLRRSLPAGDYAIIVQSPSPGAAFDLTLRLGPPTPIPPVDICDMGTEDLCDPTHAACDTSSGGIDTMVTGMFVEVGDDYTPTCSAAGRSDAVYQFTLDAPKDITLTATSGTSATTYLSLTTDCASAGSELRCETGTWGGSAEVRQRELEPGTYYVIIETDDSGVPMWNLHAVITDPVPRNPGDACSTPIDISERTVGAGGSGSVDISTLDFDSGTRCGGSSTGYLDANFVFTLDAMRDVTVTTANSTTWSTYYASLEGTCGDGTSSLRCWSGSGTVAQSWRSLPAGTYYVTASTSDRSGTLMASLETRDPTPIPPNDRCSGAIVLDSLTRRTDTTIGFEDDAPGGSCASGSMPDAFYTFTLTATSDITINVADADSSGTTFYLTLTDACGGGSELSCISGGGTGGATLNATLDPGTYSLQVESSSSDTSDYTILSVFLPH